MFGCSVTKVMVALGEMSAYLPHKKGFAGYATRYVDPAFGFALGWNYAFKYLIVTPNNINAAGVVIQYWNHNISVAVWMGEPVFDTKQLLHLNLMKFCTLFVFFWR